MNVNKLRIALVGNPNSGKTSLFNSLTGLNQKVGNFPGVTVDKKTGITSITDHLQASIIDLPGTYSLYPKRPDEWVSYNVLLKQNADSVPDIVVLVADASNLKRNLLFCSQIIDLKIPVVLALSMLDMARKKGIDIDLEGLERELGVPVVAINPRKNKGIPQLKKCIELVVKNNATIGASRDFINIREMAALPIAEVKQLLPDISDYAAVHYLINHEAFAINKNIQTAIEDIEKKYEFNATKTQADEIINRYKRIRTVMQHSVLEEDPLQKVLFTQKLDNIFLHKRWGYILLAAILFLLFQSIFWLAQYPMDLIDNVFAWLSSWLGSILPETWWSDLIVNGLLAGIGGIVVFVPQIMILFGCVTIIEDTGYMARISFLSDKIMRKVGLNGKSVMPMISGFACAVPAIMSARAIESKKERLLTILITPLMSCSARLPVFTIIIGLIIPNTLVLGVLSLRGLVMMGLYVFGLMMALLVAYIAKWFINIKEKSFFILELPDYRSPRWTNVAYTMLEKAKIFVTDAGRVIIIISLLIWGLSTYGPPQRMEAVANKYNTLLKQSLGKSDSDIKKARDAEILENSFAGILGKAIEPVIAPLGYDWKLGIALITSFAAREVFVGTMATLYSVGGNDEENNATLRQKMLAATRADGSKVYTLATGISLLIFYLLAMQCMSTLAIVKRETKSWRWPIIQFAYMTVLAYTCSWLVYQTFVHFV